MIDANQRFIKGKTECFRSGNSYQESPYQARAICDTDMINIMDIDSRLIQSFFDDRHNIFNMLA